MVALLAMTSLIVDGGNAFAQQRETQNAMDAASEAGAVVLAENLVGGNHTDQDVLNAVTSSAAQNGISNPTAVYTNIDGNSLAIPVGSLGSALPPAAAAGVRAFGSKTFSTYVGGVIGINHLTASARATAVTGQVQSCDSSQGCLLLPLTFPFSPAVCNNTGGQLVVGQPGGYPVVGINDRTAQNESILGICKSTDGNVGWLAIQPEDGNGVSDLVNDINTPDYPPLTFPIWLGVQTGNTNSAPVTNAVNNYDGQIIDIPFYDCWENGVGQVSPGPTCPSPPQTAQGNNTYYHVIGVYGFYLDKAYINGNNPQCNEAPGSPYVGGNGGTGCLKGWFVDPFFTGNVGQYKNPGAAIGVQLVR